MNSFRPRTQQLNPTFQCISSLEEFTQIDNLALSDSSLNHSYHPHHYPLHPKLYENNSQSPSKRSCLDAAPKPQQKIESRIEMKPIFDNKIPIQGYSYTRLYQEHILPRDEDLELREEDLEFLKALNQQNQRISPKKMEITEELLKQFFIHFEKKSTRQTTATKEESIIDMTAEMKESIEAADLDALYQYWRKERENEKYLRQGELIAHKEIYPFMRKYWRANSEEQTYHATFRPREYFRKKTRKSTRTDNKEIQEKLIGLEGDLKKCSFIALKIKKRELLKRELAYQNIVDFSSSVPGLEKEFKIFNSFSSRTADITALQMQIQPKLHKRKQPKVKNTQEQLSQEKNGLVSAIPSNITKEPILKEEGVKDTNEVKAERNRIKKQKYDDLSKAQSIDETKASSEIRVEEKKQKDTLKQKKGQEVDSLNKIAALQPKQEENKGDLNLASDLVENNSTVKNETENNHYKNKNENKKKRIKKTVVSGQSKEKNEGIIAETILAQKKEEKEEEVDTIIQEEIKEANVINEHITFEKPSRNISRQKQMTKQVLKEKQPEKIAKPEILKLDTEEEKVQFLSSFLVHFTSLGLPITADNVQDWEKIETKSKAIQEEHKQKLKNPNTFAYLIRQRVGRAGRVFLDRVCDDPIDVAGIQSGKISYFIEPKTKRIIYNTFSYPNPEALRVNGQYPEEKQKQPYLATTVTESTANPTQTINKNSITMPQISEEEQQFSSEHGKVKIDPSEKEFTGGVTVSDRSKQKERDIFRNSLPYKTRNAKVLSLIQQQQKQELFPGKSRILQALLSTNQNKRNHNKTHNLQRLIENAEDSDSTSQGSAQPGNNNPFQNLRQQMQLKMKEREKQKQLQLQKAKAEQQRLAKLKESNQFKNNNQAESVADTLNQNDGFFKLQDTNKLSDNSSNPFGIIPLQQQRQNSIDLMTQMMMMNEQQPSDNQFIQSDSFYPNNQFNPFNGNDQLNRQESDNFHAFDNNPHNNIESMYLPHNSIMQSPSQQQLFSPHHNASYPYDQGFANNLNNNISRDPSNNNNTMNNPYEQLNLNIPIQNNHLPHANHTYSNSEYYTNDFDRRNINIPVESQNVPYVADPTYNNINNTQPFDGSMMAVEQNYLNCGEQEENEQYLNEIDQDRNCNPNNNNEDDF